MIAAGIVRPAVVVHLRYLEGTLAVCVCRGCSRLVDPELVSLYGSLSPEYRRFKRQARARRKARRGWA